MVSAASPQPHSWFSILGPLLFLPSSSSVVHKRLGGPFNITYIVLNCFATVGGKPIPVSHMTLPTQLQQQGTACVTTSAQPVAGAATIVKQQQQTQPMVAKVLTSAQGQVISMESLLAHQKQHGTLPQGAQNLIGSV
jgi:hypothetical protein